MGKLWFAGAAMAGHHERGPALIPTRAFAVRARHDEALFELLDDQGAGSGG
jgi:hypothetical protein